VSLSGDEEVREYYLLTTNETIVNFVLEKLPSSIILASPSPQILPFGAVPTTLHDTRCYGPNHDGEDEGSDGKGSPIDGSFLSPIVPAPPVRIHNIK